MAGRVKFEARIKELVRISPTWRHWWIRCSLSGGYYAIAIENDLRATLRAHGSCRENRRLPRRSLPSPAASQWRRDVGAARSRRDRGAQTAGHA